MNTSPAEVRIEREMTDDAWCAYVTSVQTSRLDAHLRAAYFDRVRRTLGGANFVLQLVQVLGSLSAIGTLLGNVTVAATIASGIVALASGITLVMNVAEKSQRAGALAKDWQRRAAFWDEAWIRVSDARYLGPIADLRAEETGELARAEQELGFPQLDSWARAEQDRIVKTDPFLARRAAA